MKILTNKRFYQIIEQEIKPLREEIDKLYHIISKNEYKYLARCNELENEIIDLKRLLELKEKDIFKLKQKLKENKAELRIANNKLSQRYIIKELKPEKSKNTQVMKTKSSSKTSKIIKNVVNN